MLRNTILLAETKYREGGITIDKDLFQNDYIEYVKNYFSQIILVCKNGISMTINCNRNNTYCSGFLYDPFHPGCIDLSLAEICKILF